MTEYDPELAELVRCAREAHAILSRAAELEALEAHELETLEALDRALEPYGGTD